MNQKTRWILPVTSMRPRATVRGKEVGKLAGMEEGMAQAEFSSVLLHSYPHFKLNDCSHDYRCSQASSECKYSSPPLTRQKTGSCPWLLYLCFSSSASWTAVLTLQNQGLLLEPHLSEPRKKMLKGLQRALPTAQLLGTEKLIFKGGENQWFQRDTKCSRGC